MQDKRFGYIKGLSDQRRLPLLGKIRLGIKSVSEKTGEEYPKEVNYFVLPEEVKRVYLSTEPTEIDIMFPLSDRATIFNTAYRHYGLSRGLKCMGNGEIALERSEDNRNIKEIPCPCEKLDQRKCSQKAFLMFMIPKINMSGVYQICTSSFNSIVDINSSLDFIESLIGRIQMVPLKLKRERIETHHDGKKQVHYTMKIIFDGTAEFVNQLRENTRKIMLQESIKLPPPDDVNPEYDAAVEMAAKGIKDKENERKETKQLPAADQEPKKEPKKEPVKDAKTQNSDIDKMLISERQVERVYAIANEHKVTNEEMKAWAKEKLNVLHLRDIPRKEYDKLCDFIVTKGKEKKQQDDFE